MGQNRYLHSYPGSRCTSDMYVHLVYATEYTAYLGDTSSAEADDPYQLIAVSQ